MFPTKYTYLIGVLIFFLVWLFLFLQRKDLRREILLMSTLIAPMGPLSELFYLRDYWKPELFSSWTIGFEDLLFGFFIGGIAGVIYEEVFRTKYAPTKLKVHPRWIIGMLAFEALIIIIGTSFLKFNSIYTSTLGFFVVGCAMLIIRKDLIRDALFSGALVGGLMFLFYLFYIGVFPRIIERWWMLENISGVFILGIPLEELTWAFGWGFVAGPMYEFISGKVLY